MLCVNKDTVDDLKTFLTTLIGQHVGGLRDDMNDRFAEVDARFDAIDKKFTGLFAHLDQKIDDLSDSVGEALHNFDAITEERLEDHETRITKLESAKA